jgi:Xaa-Pro aminopeptidase
MTDIFTADFFINNRQKLLQQTEAKLVVLSANGLLQRSADTTFPFRQDSNFWYLTGVSEPDYVLVLEQDEVFLIAPKRADHRDQWDGLIDKRAVKSISGIKQIVEHHEGWTKLDMLLKKHKKVHTITPVEAYFDHFGFYANPSKGVLLSSLAKHRKLEQVDIRLNIARLRQIKQPEEIQAIQKAIDITAKSLKSVKRKLSKYTNERQIVADLSRDFINASADGHAYQPIVATGGNATTIHYIKNNQDIHANDLVLLDVGAEVQGYSADITRTYSTSTPSKRQISVHKAVLSVQEQAFALLKPGIDMKKYEKTVDSIMAIELKKLGLLDDVNDKKRLKKYYPHLTSHFLGLDTHDAADYKQPLKAGMVLTVEPGIYIPDENIGVRIEDDVLVTDDGIKVLSSGLPTSLY